VSSVAVAALVCARKTAKSSASSAYASKAIGAYTRMMTTTHLCVCHRWRPPQPRSLVSSCFMAYSPRFPGLWEFHQNPPAGCPRPARGQPRQSARMRNAALLAQDSWPRSLANAWPPCSASRESSTPCIRLCLYRYKNRHFLQRGPLRCCDSHRRFAKSFGLRPWYKSTSPDNFILGYHPRSTDPLLAP